MKLSVKSVNVKFLKNFSKILVKNTEKIIKKNKKATWK